MWLLIKISKLKHLMSYCVPNRTAISNIYEAIFHNKTHYSGPLIMGWNNKNTIQELSKDVEFFPVSVTVRIYKIFLFSVGTSSNITWKKAGNGYKSSLVHPFDEKL